MRKWTAFIGYKNNPDTGDQIDVEAESKAAARAKVVKELTEAYSPMAFIERIVPLEESGNAVFSKL